MFTFAVFIAFVLAFWVWGDGGWYWNTLLGLLLVADICVRFTNLRNSVPLATSVFLVETGVAVALIIYFKYQAAR